MFEPVQIVPLLGIDYDSKTETYFVKELSAKVELVLANLPALHSRWVVLSGRIFRKGKDLECKLILQGKSTVEYSIPVNCRGIIIELIKIPSDTERIVFQPMNSTGEFKILENFCIKPVNIFERKYRMLRRVLFFFNKIYQKERRKTELKWYDVLFNLDKAYEKANLIRDCAPVWDYEKWIRTAEILNAKEIKAIKKKVDKNTLNTKFLICCFTLGHQDNTRELELTENSLKKQLYKNYELLILSEDNFENLNDHLSDDMYLIFLPAGTTLSAHALYWLAEEIERTNSIFIYSDHDYLGEHGKRFNPYFKPDFSAEFLKTLNYIDFAFVVKCSLFKTLKIKKDALFSYDCHSFLFNVMENVSSFSIRHIPAILFHLPESILKKTRALERSDNPVKEHFDRAGVKATIERLTFNSYKIIYTPFSFPLTSIIIPSKDNLFFLKRCIDNIINKTTYKNFEIIVVNNQSRDHETLRYLEKIKTYQGVKVFDYPYRFNYAGINNFAVRKARGEVIVFLNDDTEVITPQWLEIMLGCLEQFNVGAVGARLYYEDDTIQHAGVIIGMNGCSDHIFKGLEKENHGYMNRACLLQEYSAVTAACMMTWKDVFLKIGGFDELNLKIAFNDVDYCLKLREAGYRIIFTPYAELYHFESKSRQNYYQKITKKEANFIRKKWAKYIKNDPYYNPNLDYKTTNCSFNLCSWVEKPWKR